MTLAVFRTITNLNLQHQLEEVSRKSVHLGKTTLRLYRFKIDDFRAIKIYPRQGSCIINRIIPLLAKKTIKEDTSVVGKNFR